MYHLVPIPLPLLKRMFQPNHPDEHIINVEIPGITH